MAGVEEERQIRAIKLAAKLAHLVLHAALVEIAALDRRRSRACAATGRRRRRHWRDWRAAWHDGNCRCRSPRRRELAACSGPLPEAERQRLEPRERALRRAVAAGAAGPRPMVASCGNRRAPGRSCFRNRSSRSAAEPAATTKVAIPRRPRRTVARGQRAWRLRRLPAWSARRPAFSLPALVPRLLHARRYPSSRDQNSARHGNRQGPEQGPLFFVADSTIPIGVEELRREPDGFVKFYDGAVVFPLCIVINPEAIVDDGGIGIETPGSA